VFGPRQNPDSQYAAVIPLFIRALLQDRPPTIFGDGEQTRDFTYVANVVQANLRAADLEAQGVMNVACGHRITVNELTAGLKELIGAQVDPVYVSSRPGDIIHSLADIERARKALDFDPSVDVQEGLRRTVDWYRSRL
jgi:UDP-glucose 4-epimerase